MKIKQHTLQRLWHTVWHIGLLVLFFSAVGLLVLRGFKPCWYASIQSFIIPKRLVFLLSSDGFKILGTSIGVTGGALSFLISRIEQQENGIPVYRLIRWKYGHFFRWFYLLFFPSVAMQIYFSTIGKLLLPQALFSIVSFVWLLILARINYLFALSPEKRNKIMWAYFDDLFWKNPQARPEKQDYEDAKRIFIQTFRSLNSLNYMSHQKQLNELISRWGYLRYPALDIQGDPAMQQSDWRKAFQESSQIWSEIISFPMTWEDFYFVLRIFQETGTATPNFCPYCYQNDEQYKTWSAMLLGFLCNIYNCPVYIYGNSEKTPLRQELILDLAAQLRQTTSLDSGKSCDVLLAAACIESYRFIVTKEMGDRNFLRKLYWELMREKIYFERKDNVERFSVLCKRARYLFESVSDISTAEIIMRLYESAGKTDLNYDGVMWFLSQLF